AVAVAGGRGLAVVPRGRLGQTRRDDALVIDVADRRRIGVREHELEMYRARRTVRCSDDERRTIVIATAARRDDGRCPDKPFHRSPSLPGARRCARDRAHTYLWKG